MLPNEVPLKASQYPISPFKKVPNFPQQKSKYNFYNDSRHIYYPNSQQEKYMHTPLQFGVNVYFGQPKSNLNHHPNYIRQPPMPDFYAQNSQEQIPICILFKNSLAKSGYKLTPEQTVLYRDAYKKLSSVNSFYDILNDKINPL